MSDKNATNRLALIKIATLVRPALATQNYIPALTHIRLDGEHATAYNDVSAIMVRAKIDVAVCLPGELLIKALNSFSADSISMQEAGKDKALVLSSGRSKLKLPTFTAEQFPFILPETSKGDMLDLTASILKGIEQCLMSVGNDPTHPAQMGVTLDMDSTGNAVLYSTDNFTISRYQTKTLIELPGDSPVILPTFFCQQLVSLSKAFPEDEVCLHILPGALLAEFGKNAKLFNKTLVDLEPLDFPRIFDKHCKLDGLKRRVFTIPDSWESAFNRAMLVMGGESDKVTQLTVTDDSIKLYSTSSLGDSNDTLSFDGDPGQAPEGPFHIDPALVLRSSKACGLMTFNERALALADADAQFVHLIAYCSK